MEQRWNRWLKDYRKMEHIKQRLTENLSDRKNLSQGCAESKMVNGMKMDALSPGCHCQSRSGKVRDSMERLTYVAENGEVLFHPADLPDDEGITITQLAKDGRYKALEEIAERLANREQAEEQGLLLRLPCKVGDTLYRVNKGAKEPVIMMRVIQLYIKQIHNITVMRIDAINDADMGESCYLPCDIGERIFLTREEAEAKLAEMEGEHGE